MRKDTTFTGFKNIEGTSVLRVAEKLWSLSASLTIREALQRMYEDVNVLSKALPPLRPFDTSDVALNKVSSEVKLGRIAVPFLKIPYPNLKCTLLSLRGKSTPGTYRLQHNLSHPYDHTAVNFGIPDKSKTVNFASLNDAIIILRSRPRFHGEGKYQGCV